MTKIVFIKSVLIIVLCGLTQPAMSAPLVINGSDQVGCPLATCGDPFAGGVVFQTDNTLFVQNGQDIGQTSGVSVTVTGGNNIGQLFFQGTSTILGSVSLTGDILRLLTVGPGAIVTADGSIRVTTVDLDGGGSTLIMANGTNLNTTQINGSNSSAAILALQGTNTVTGEIGSSSGAVAVDLIGLTGTVTTTGDITGSVNFINSNQELIIAAGKNINGPVTTTVNDAGTLTFQGSSVSGGTIGALHQVNINGGVFQLNNNIFATNTTVAACATLDIQSNVEISSLTNNGIVQLGSITNPVHVIMDSGYKGNPGSIIDFFVTNGGATFSHIATAVFGMTVIPQNGMHIIVSGDTIPNGTTIRVITTFGTLSLAPMTPPPTATYRFIPTVDASGLTITFERTPITTFAFPFPILASVADFFESIGPNIQTIAPGLVPVFDALNAQANGCEIQNALANLALPVNGDLLSIYHGGTTRGFDVIAERMDNNRGEFARGMTRYKYACFREYCDNIPCNYYMHSGQWIEFFGSAIDQKEDHPLEGLGYRGRQWTLIAGYDKSFYPSFNAGVAFAYSQLQTNSKDVFMNHLKADSFQGYLYATHETCRGSYWDAIVSLVYNDYNQDREIDLLSGVSSQLSGCGINTTSFGFIENAHGRFGGWQFNGYFEGGYQFRCKQFVVVPHAILRTAYLRLDEFSETGAPLTGYKNIQYDDMQALELGGGLKVAKSYICYKKYKFVPYAKLIALRDFKNTPQRVNAEFIGGGPAFLTTGPEKSANSLTASMGLTLNRRDNTFLTLEYDFERRTDFAVYGAFLKYRVEWC